MEHTPKKSLGQNFLQDAALVGEIAALAIEELPALEIGPGTGVLTAALAHRASELVAVELDSALVPKLEARFASLAHVHIVEGDVLRLNLPALLEEKGFAGRGYQVVANLPYYITAPIIRMLLELPVPPQKLVLMVQHEVAERLAAPPGGLSILGVMAQYYARVTKKIFVPREAFFPVPKVDSAVVELVPYRTAAPADRAFFRIVRLGFAARRKTLANNLGHGLGLGRSAIEAHLAVLGLRPDVRAQALTLGQWEGLAMRLSGPLAPQQEQQG